MANWRSYIDPSVGDGQNTLDSIIANGPTYGIGISDDLSVTGLSTFSDIARFSSTIRLDGQLRDGDNAFGTSGQVLSSDGTDTRWVNAGSLSAGAASLVAINDDNNTNADRFITFVDSSSGNNAVKTDAALKYNPSTNTVSLVGGSIQSQNASGTRVTLMDTDGSIEITRESGPFIDFKTSNSEDHDCRIQMENDGLTFTTGGNGSTSKKIKLDTNGHLLPITDSAFDIGSNAMRFRNIYADNFTGNLTGNTSGSSGSCTGNAASATVLQTSRTIGGVNFNGSANINLPGVNEDGNQNTSGNAATATVLETTRNFSISGEITANAQSFNGSGNVTLSATVDNNIIDEANLKVGNNPVNGYFLQAQSGDSGGLRWAQVTLPSSSTLSGTTLASGITASSITSLGTLTGLSVDGTASVTGTLTSGALTIDVNGNDEGATTLLTLDNYIDDIGLEYTWIDFTFRDSNVNATPQVKIGAQAKDPTGNQVQEGTADFVVQCGVDNNSTSNTMTEMFRCSHETKITSVHHHPQTDSTFDLGTNSTRWRNVYSDNVYGNGSNLTSLNASQLSSGTLPAARLPNHSASLLTSGTIPSDRLPNHSASLLTSGTIPAARLPNHSASLLTSGTIPAARVPTLNQNTTGSAAKLTTARTIAGTSFNGTANININYNNLTNKPTIPTNNNQLSNGAGYITATDVRSMNEATSTGTSSTTSSVMQNKVTLSISTASNSRVLVLFSFEIKHSNNNNQRTYARVTGDNISFVGGNFEASHSNQTWTEFQGHRLDISSHTGTRTYKIQWNRNSNTGSIRNACLVAIEMSV